VGLTEAALSRSADLVAKLLPAPEPKEEFVWPWGIDAWHDPGYPQWFRDRSSRLEAAEALPTSGPLISVVVPVYRPKAWYLRACVSSVLSQRYRSWELCLCDDASGDPQLSALLGEFAASDPRVKVVERTANGGISAATNDALELATGELVALLDHDDLLEPDALSEIAAAVTAAPDIDIVYSDEDKVFGDGGTTGAERLACPHFKPDWSPELLLSYPYMGHLLVVRRSLLDEIGGFRSEFDGSQDYDVMLRATERARRVAHVRRVLYHWRVIEGSAAGDSDAKPWAHVASRRAVEDALRRRGVDAVVADGAGPGWYHVRRSIASSPRVAVVVPFRDQAAMTANCLGSLRTAPGYEDFEVVLVDNESTEPETRALLHRIHASGVRVLEYHDAFNWSAMNNLAAAACDADLLLFMNNDIEATTPGWLRALVELAQRSEVGAVGARLLYPDGVLQHAGVTLGMGVVAAHVFAGMPAGGAGYMAWDRVVRQCGAVTGACLMSRREVFEEVGGFDESLEVAYNDVDYCMRLTDAGYSVLYTPHAEMVHHESASRGISGFFGDMKRFCRKWERSRLLDDPFYNPNLSLFGTWCGLRAPGETRIWNSQMDAIVGG